MVNKFSQVVEILEKIGKSDQEIAEFTKKVEQVGFTQLFLEATVYLTDDDFKAIESCEDQDQANRLIKKRYILRTGKNPEHEMKKFLDEFSEEFIKQHNQDQIN